MKTETPFQLILENASVRTALVAAANTEDAQLEVDGLALTPEQSLHVCQWTAKNLRAAGVEQLICYGGLIYVMLKTTEKEDRRSFLLSIADDLGITETKAYDSIAAFRCFGERLLESPELMQRFTMEPLKKLSSKRASTEAREAAIGLAISGQRVTAEKAEALIAEYDATPEAAPELEVEVVAATVNEADPVKGSPENSSSSPPNRGLSKPIWEYEGHVIRLIIEADGEEVLPHVSVIHDIEAALDQYRRDCAAVDTTTTAEV